jgi:hypothetical protein
VSRLIFAPKPSNSTEFSILITNKHHEHQLPSQKQSPKGLEAALKIILISKTESLIDLEFHCDYPRRQTEKKTKFNLRKVFDVELPSIAQHFRGDLKQYLSVFYC